MDHAPQDLSETIVPEHALDVVGWSTGGNDDFRDGLRHSKVAPSTIVAVVLAGRYEVWREDGSRSVAGVGEAFIAQDGEWLDILHAGSPMRARWVHLRIRVFGSVDAIGLWRLPPVLPASQAAQVLGLIDATHPAEPGLLGAAHRSQAALATLRILASVGTPSVEGRRLLARAEELAPLAAWAEPRLAEPLAVADLARAAGLSASRLHARFQHLLGTTPMAWLKELRLLAARDRLLATEDSVAACGASCGFPDAFHFSRSFRARFGASPRAFRRRAALQV